MEAREMLERMRDAVCDCEGDSLEKVQAALRELVDQTGWWSSGSGMIAGTKQTPEETIAFLLRITELDL